MDGDNTQVDVTVTTKPEQTPTETAEQTVTEEAPAVATMIFVQSQINEIREAMNQLEQRLTDLFHSNNNEYSERWRMFDDLTARIDALETTEDEEPIDEPIEEDEVTVIDESGTEPTEGNVETVSTEPATLEPELTKNHPGLLW